MPTTSYENWDFHNYHVQQEMKAGQFVNAESTLIGAGPPDITPSTKGGDGTGSPTEVYPIGLIETIGIQQSKQLQRIFEIGSSRSYFIPGRVIGSVNMGRTFYFGPSLLKVLYAYYKNEANSINVNADDQDATVNGDDGEAMASPGSSGLSIFDPAQLKTLRQSPGEDYFFINLASDMFNQGTGIAVYFKTSYATTVGAMYLENCYIQGHQMTISSGSVLVMEGVSAQFDRVVPIKMINSAT